MRRIVGGSTVARSACAASAMGSGASASSAAFDSPYSSALSATAR
jgi:hypothetical protein